MMRIALGAWAFGLLTVVGWGQTAGTGTIIGTATDPSGAVVPGAKVELQEVASSIKRSTLTNTSGQYSFVGLQPGAYSVRAGKPGFQELAVPQVAVEVGRSYTVNLVFQIGGTSSVVEVTSTPGAELQTLDASVGNAVGGEPLLMMPTLQRNATS